MKLKSGLLSLACLLPLLAGHAEAQRLEAGSVVVAPGGKASYSVVDADTPKERIVECTEQCSKKRVVLAGKSGKKPEQNLFGFSNLRLSPDATTLYFETDAWATSNAVHALSLKTGAERFVADGHMLCILGDGEHQGDIVVSQHRYFVQGGTYNPLNLLTPEGELVGVVALDDTDAPKFCAPRNSL